MHSHYFAQNQIIFLVSPSSSLLHESNLQALLAELNTRESYVSQAASVEKVEDKLSTEYNISSLLIDAHFLQSKAAAGLSQLLQNLNDRFNGLPVFLLLEEAEASPVPLRIPEKMHELINIKEDSPSFIAGRIRYAIRYYEDNLLPPYFKALKNFAEDSPYYWDCPGHQGGVAYLKHQVGRAFIHFFGENIMRADIGIATPELGDWLEHKGAPAESEAAAARIFGADMTFYVTGGSSQSNQIVGHGVLSKDTLVLVDRNCHKSVNHELTISSSKPVYFKPERNGLGIIGLIPLEQFKANKVQERVKASPFGQTGEVGYAVVTNCTYDGLIYNVDKVTEALAESTPRIKYDEAWYAYAKFHPLYKSRFAMGVPRDLQNCPTLFSVQSTHKMLAAFSSASMIHIRNSSRAPVDKEIFNQSFAMHGTTSPFYPLIASIDVATAMMEGEGGKRLLHDALVDAITCRKTIVRTGKQLKSRKSDDWFFGVWQATHLPIQGLGLVPFEEVQDEILLEQAELWHLKKEDSWHGFKHVDGDYAMLDPLKVTITCPGALADGRVEAFGIPAPIVCQYLNAQRIIQARNGDYNILVLFALGSTRGKWASLIESLLEFKRLHDSDASVARALPHLAKSYPQYYSLSLKELCAQMHQVNSSYGISTLAGAACEAQAQPVYTPAEAYQYLIGGKTEKIRVQDMLNRTAGLMITPYPPGIPVLMPGEKITSESRAILDYLLALQNLDKKFPGFSHELQGIEVDEAGEYWIRCIKE